MSTSNSSYLSFIKWYVMPPNERQPKTQAELMAVLGITNQDVAEYQQRDTFHSDIYREAQNWGKMKIPELLHTLYQEFKETKKPALLETYKKLLEIDKKEGGNSFNFVVLDPTDEQYKQIIAREARHITISGEESPAKLLPTD